MRSDNLMRTHQRYTRARVALAVLALWAIGIPAHAAHREPDRLGLRVGAWPQRDVSGTLAAITFRREPDTTYDAVVNERGMTIPFLEFFGLFHLGGIWWAEGSIGWSRRSDVQVDGRRQGVPPTDSLAHILLGEGKVDFIPLFLGARAEHRFGVRPRPHNVYLRGGGSLVIASESPNLIHPRVAKTVYKEGTKGAFGFLLGIGGEYYVADRFALTGDLSYRYASFNYSSNAKLNESTIWLAIGMAVSTR